MIEGMWVVLALLCAFSLATADALTKKALEDQGEFLVGWLRLLFAAPAMAFILLSIEWPSVDAGFYRAIALALPLEILAYALYVRALRVSPLGLTLPFLAFTPLILIGSSAVILGERVTVIGTAGIALIVAGGYTLNIHHIRSGLFGPIRAIAREKGSVLMLTVAVVYSLTAALGKAAINHSSPLFCGAVYFLILPLLYTPFAVGEIRRFRLSRRTVRFLVPAGACYAVMVVTHVLAVSMTEVAYMVSVKRTSLLFGVLYGHLLFGEMRFREKVLGTSLMFAGCVVLAVLA
jgi:drug/metabolite transporter (DMT)-like permease